MSGALFWGLGIFLSICAGVCGVFCVKHPETAIRRQQDFYAKINWRMEPISMGKEIKNTRLMGAFLVLLSCASLWIFLR